MTEDDYKAGIRSIEEHFLRVKKEFQRSFAMANNPYKVGDIVKDQIGNLKIEKIKWAITYNSLPCCVYTGVELRADLTPMKKQTGRTVYQTNIDK